MRVQWTRQLSKLDHGRLNIMIAYLKGDLGHLHEGIDHACVVVKRPIEHATISPLVRVINKEVRIRISSSMPTDLNLFLYGREKSGIIHGRAISCYLTVTADHVNGLASVTCWTVCHRLTFRGTQNV